MLGAQPKEHPDILLLYLEFCSQHFSIQKFKNKCLYTLYSWRSRWLFQHLPGRQFSPSQKRNAALIIPGWYCSHVTLHTWHVWSLGTSHHNNHISNSPPWQRKIGTPWCQVQLKVGKKKGWLILVTFISVVLVASLLAVT